MSKTIKLILTAAVLVALASCKGSFVDPGVLGGMMDGNSGWDDNGNGNGNGSGKGNVGILTFTDKLPSDYLDWADVFVIANSVNTSASNWKNTAIVAHLNSRFDGYKVDQTAKTVTLSVPARSLTVANNSDVSSSDKAWTGGGTYAVYVAIGYTEKILKNVTFSNGCATVLWSNFTDL
jgi:hypothetical protein